MTENSSYLFKSSGIKRKRRKFRICINENYKYTHLYGHIYT